MHALVVTCRMIWDMQPIEEAREIRLQRMNVVRTFKANRDRLARDPVATQQDVAMLDHLIGWAERKLGWLPVEEKERRDQRRREKTRDRARRYRERKRAEGLSQTSDDMQSRSQ